MADPSILIVKLGAVGDCVHTLFALRALRERYPAARIDWVVEDKSRAVVDGHPDLTEVVRFPRKELSAALRGRPDQLLATWSAFLGELRARRYDIAIDFQNLFKSGLATAASGARRRIGFRKLREGNFLFTNERPLKDPAARHAVERYFTLLRPLGIDAIPERVEVFVPEDKRAAADRFFDAQGWNDAPVAAFNPGASWQNKKLDVRKYAAVADALAERGVRGVVIWGPGEEKDAEALASAARSKPAIAPRTDIKELHHLLRRCRLYVGNDSGPMHLAAAAGIGVVGVFGPTDPARVAPWSPRARVVQADVRCGPCWKKSCTGPMNCIDRVDARRVTEAALSLLEPS
jgi:lipopolysaccharide heptosyltransferase I